MEYATFTPAELQAIAGISVETQRDWRRRGLLEKSSDGKHKRFVLHEVAYLAALKHVINIGVPVSEARIAASGASKPIEQHALVADKLMTGEPPRFVVVAEDGGSFRCDDLAMAHKAMAKRAATAFLVLDCQAIGRMIQKRAGKPLQTWA